MTPLGRPIIVLGTALALGIAVMSDAAAEPAQPPVAPAKPEPAKLKLKDIPDIIFYVAKGDANACGSGCDQWIAADGKIDNGAPQRLRRVLAKLGKRRLPIFFHSPGGTIGGSLELGRLIRQHKLTAGVARTIPRDCDPDKLYDKPCQALKDAGAEITSEFDADVFMCNSGCVYALIGGKERLVPPWGRLGIHAVGMNPKAGPLSPAAAKARARVSYSKIDEFLRDMGFDVTLRLEAAATPFESVRMLHRDEFARLGIDTRDFGETDWRYKEKPKPRIFKTFFVRTDNEQLVHRSATLVLSCGSGKGMVLGLVRELAPSESADESAPLSAKAWGHKFDLVMKPSNSNNAAPSGPRWDAGVTLLPATGRNC
jgi:hypothetical protein